MEVVLFVFSRLPLVNRHETLEASISPPQIIADPESTCVSAPVKVTCPKAQLQMEYGQDLCFGAWLPCRYRQDRRS